MAPDGQEPVPDVRGEGDLGQHRMRRCVPSRAVVESLQASGIQAVQVTYHYEEIVVHEMIVAHQPLPVPPTWRYMRNGEWYEMFGMPKEKRR